MGGTPYSAIIIDNVYISLEALEIISHTNGVVVEGLADINGHRGKEVGESKSVSWVDARTKGEGRECKVTKNIFFYRHLFCSCV